MATINATDASLTAVQSAVNSASDGDMVVIPPVSLVNAPTWTGSLSWSGKNIMLIGSGVDDTLGTNIILSPNSGTQVIKATLVNSNTTCRFSQIRFHMVSTNPASNNGYVFQLQGTSTMHLVAAVATGGIRLDNLRFTASSDTFGGQNGIFKTVGWLTGVIDHCFLDYSTTTVGSEIFDISQSSSTNGSTTPEGTRALYGDWSLFKPYVMGGGLTNGGLDAIYLEDNVFHKNGIVLDQLSGGSRVVVRHNTSWGGLSGHGMETGNNAGCRAAEIYNNFMTAPTVTAFNAFACRSGSYVNFNNRISAWKNGTTGSTVFALYGLSATATMVGPHDGTNFYDQNERDTINYNTYSFVPVSTPSDTRIGSVYANGTDSKNPKTNQFILTGLDGGLTANKWAGFCVRNLTTAGTESSGGQSTYGGLSWGLILSSTTGPNSTVTVISGSNGNFTLGFTDPWEIRRVKVPFQVPGSGQTGYLLNGGNFKNSASDPALLCDNTGTLLGAPNPRWPNQNADGVYCWGNKYRTGTTGSFSDCTTPSSQLSNFIPGGIIGTPMLGYPTQPNIAANLRIGADWAATTEKVESTDSGAATQAYGAPYPHPLVSSLTPPLVPLVSMGFWHT